MKDYLTITNSKGERFDIDITGANIETVIKELDKLPKNEKGKNRITGDISIHVWGGGKYGSDRYATTQEKIGGQVTNETFKLP